jgi:histidinol phosphatase-like PHP family hydrolase
LRAFVRFTFRLLFLYLFRVIDLHTHTVLSDGELLPFELVRRAVSLGYRAIAITDHVDASNIDFVVPRIVRAVEMVRGHAPIEVIPGAEITHAPPGLVMELVKEARALGAAIVVVHGETIVEPVEPGTNRAAIEAGADIVSHPGLISTEDILLAKERGVALEITARKGHSLANGYVAQEAVRFGVPLTMNTDAHSPSDLISRDTARRILRAAGIEDNRIDSVFETSEAIVQKALRRTHA